jgi:hypothetical protein
MNSTQSTFPAVIGRPVPPFSQAPSRRRSRVSKRVRHAIRVLFVGILVAIGSMVCLGAISWVRSQAAVKVVEAQVRAIRGGKVEEAYSLFSSSYQSAHTLPMFRRDLRRREPLDRVQKLEFWGRSVWGQTAVLWGNFQDDLGHNYPVRYLLVKENGAWRVDNFHLSADIPDSVRATVRFIQT